MKLRKLFTPKAPAHIPDGATFRINFPSDANLNKFPLEVRVSLEDAIARISAEKARLTAAIAEANQDRPLLVIVSDIERQQVEVRQRQQDTAQARGKVLIATMTMHECGEVVAREDRARNKLQTLFNEKGRRERASAAADELKALMAQVNG
ncbi:hypothetical protein [Paraburkholderia humisilvae]|uniref:Uncharacterized protein n=1 Tax=Paraburkholderia humisilvae TaxID=627669 RepID=A0A6J5CWS0_9BURK|nr:hypothetical protein [Paraburkholderia humisilvae]CAB3746428.1 hypothetical protein LMG29542_00208 [Paraburkholderia humisilvae]